MILFYLNEFTVAAKHMDDLWRMLLPDLTYPAILVFVPRDLGLMRSLAEVFLPIVTLSALDLSLK